MRGCARCSELRGPRLSSELRHKKAEEFRADLELRVEGRDTVSAQVDAEETKTTTVTQATKAEQVKVSCGEKCQRARAAPGVTIGGAHGKQGWQTQPETLSVRYNLGSPGPGRRGAEETARAPQAEIWSTCHGQAAPWTWSPRDLVFILPPRPALVSLLCPEPLSTSSDPFHLTTHLYVQETEAQG